MSGSITKSLAERDVSDHIKCVALKPVPKIEGLLFLSKL